MPESQTASSRPLALVTGASSGIGYELARKFAERGYDLVMVSSDQAKLDEAAHNVTESNGDAQVQIVQADLSRPDEVEKVYESVRALQRPVDVLAANAGVGVYGEFADNTDLDDEIALINLNVTSQVHLIKRVSQDMIERGEGDILITSSVAGVLPAPRMAVYAASKAFLRSFGQAIRNEMKDKGVNVTVLMPGPTETEFFERAQMTDTVAGQGSKQDASEVAEEALEALEHGADHVVTGVKNKVQVGVAKSMSDQARTKMHGKMTKKKRPKD
jgi:uncharacterized protein